MSKTKQICDLVNKHRSFFVVHDFQNPMQFEAIGICVTNYATVVHLHYYNLQLLMYRCCFIIPKETT